MRVCAAWRVVPREDAVANAARIGRVFSSAAVADVVGEVRAGDGGPTPTPGCFYHYHGGAANNPQTRIHNHSNKTTTRTNNRTSAQHTVVYTPGQSHSTAVVRCTDLPPGYTGSRCTDGSSMGSKRIYDRHLAQFVYSCSPSRGCHGYRYRAGHALLFEQRDLWKRGGEGVFV